MLVFVFATGILLGFIIGYFLCSTYIAKRTAELSVELSKSTVKEVFDQAAKKSIFLERELRQMK